MGEGFFANTIRGEETVLFIAREIFDVVGIESREAVGEEMSIQVCAVDVDDSQHAAGDGVGDLDFNFALQDGVAEEGAALFFEFQLFFGEGLIGQLQTGQANGQTAAILMNHLEGVAIVHRDSATFDAMERRFVFNAAVFIDVMPDVERFERVALEPDPIQAGADECDEGPLYGAMEEIKHRLSVLRCGCVCRG